MTYWPLLDHRHLLVLYLFFLIFFKKGKKSIKKLKSTCRDVTNACKEEKEGEREGEKDIKKRQKNTGITDQQCMQVSQLAIYLVSSCFYFSGGFQRMERH